MPRSTSIVLVDTTHPGNIGAAARAMKTMSHDRLRLVRPRYFPNAVATARAAGADDVLASAVVYSCLRPSIEDCQLVVGVTARQRSLSLPAYSPRSFADWYIRHRVDADVALLFGCESSGLSNADLEHCNLLLHIPGNPAYGSLNLAAAVQLVCYELWLARCDETGTDEVMREKPSVPFAAQGDMEHFYQHLQDTMQMTGFYDPEKPRRLMSRLRRLFNRAQLDSNELNILRGFLASVRKARDVSCDERDTS